MLAGLIRVDKEERSFDIPPNLGEAAQNGYKVTLILSNWEVPVFKKNKNICQR